jgi:hypothetical protein
MSIEHKTQNGPLTTRHNSFITQVADVLAHRAGSSLVYGEPVSRGDVTIIPVSRVKWIVAGGEGPNEKGSGGMGRLHASPAGYIEVREGKARFHPIFSPFFVMQIILSAGLIAFLLQRGVRDILEPIFYRHRR